MRKTDWETEKKIYAISVKIVNKLTKGRKKLAFAESCTGGMAASSIVAVDGASEVLSGGIVAYTPEAKEKWLGVSKKTMKKYGLVSAKTAKEMARGAILKSGADYALSFTGLAGRGDNGNIQLSPKIPADRKTVRKMLMKNPDVFKPVGLVYIAVARKNKKRVFAVELNLTGGRNTIRKKAVLAGLYVLYQIIS